MDQKIVQNFFTTSGNNIPIGKETQKPCPKLKNMYIIYLTQNICSSCIYFLT